ncbi:MAG: hypothetical protein NZ953_00830 [Thaumarchaeota archaeon]|nr:hypothetical protein [Candidatus Calditenuaceae archaeon]MDW8043935.1 hypothetical protein [Nitrososphaerota archaeon]
MGRERRTVQRIAEFFRRAGYSVEVEEDQIRISQGSIEGSVRVVHEDATAAELFSALIEASMDAATGKAAYVAAPERVAVRIGEHVFRLYGLGLVEYGDDFVEESIPPKFRPSQAPAGQAATAVESRALEEVMGAIAEVLKRIDQLETTIRQQIPAPERQAVQVSGEDASGLIARIERLEARVSSLEKLGEIASLIEKLRARLEQLAARVEALESAGKREVRAERSEQAPKEVPPEPVQLPSFLKDNPWVEILSKRGKE